MKLVTNAKIFTQDGKGIGTLKRVVLDPKSQLITHIVFERGAFSPREYLIPMQLVDHVDEQGIHLVTLPIENPDDLPPFHEDEYIVTNEEGLISQGMVSEDSIRSYYYYPPAPFGGAGITRPDEMYMRNPPASPPIPNQLGIPNTGEPPVQHVVEENIPEGTVAMKEGARVMSSDLKHLGNVEKVYVDPKNMRASHLLISKGLLLKERKLVPANWVAQVAEDTVILVVDEAFANRLPDFKE